MAHKTAKLGGTASDVVVAKIAVSHGKPVDAPRPHSNLFLSISYSRWLVRPPTAWAYGDDMEPDAHLGRRGFRVNQSRHRHPASGREDVSQQR